ncbi:sulfonate ABC transporter substrate-binding protein [Reyranella sp. CPCC 100927]|uniref:sulfonate ABC transporter substrate-binding protein n=1 Tax=Reyranella sp. CPCC 100927 TaxID=2599616 RepID=UPI0011B48BE8|nr:sulfonate ABC transporter substrate-binding protein [Reyranella sp. CPCC 100927]TWS95675.1 sulfonate ABC transporter substrate-binding protein [Reyranella sp. CPCC 100927]
MTTRRFLLGAALGAVAFAGTAAAQDLREFRIGYQKGGIFSVVKQQKTIEARLKTLGIDTVKWIEFQYGPPLMEALGLGAIDIGPVGDTPPLFAQAAGANVVYIASNPASESALIVPQSSPIKTLADLKGKKIAFAKGSSSHNLTVRLLAKGGLTYADVTPIYLTPADAAAAFARGSIDAWTIWDPYYAIAELRQNARTLASTKDVGPSNSFYLANRVFAGRHPAILKAVIEEVAKVTEWADKNRDKLAAAIAEITGVELKAQQVAVERATIALRPLSEAVITQQQEIADTFHQLGLIPKPIVVRDAVWRPSGS